jgi:hypothetical protein
MNRRERRSIEKKIGLTKFYSSMSRDKRFSKMAENITNGKKKHDEFVESVRVNLESKRDERDTEIRAEQAQELAAREKIPYIDALNKVNEQYK